MSDTAVLIGESIGVSRRAFFAQPINQSVYRYTVAVCCTLSFHRMVADSGSHAPRCHLNTPFAKCTVVGNRTIDYWLEPEIEIFEMVGSNHTVT